MEDASCIYDDFSIHAQDAIIVLFITKCIIQNTKTLWTVSVERLQKITCLSLDFDFRSRFLPISTRTNHGDHSITCLYRELYNQ